MESKKVDYHRLMNVAIHAGAIMMENGAETYRVEDTINHILELADKKDSSSLVIATAIAITLYEEDEQPMTVVRRIHRRGVNLNMVYQVNNLSRSLCRGALSLKEAEEELKQFENEKQYGRLLNYIGICGVSSTFTVLVGGSLFDASAALLIGIALAAMMDCLDRTRITKFFRYTIAGLLVAVLARFAESFAPFPLDSGAIIIGSIMPILPGILFTNAIRDILYGDYMAAVVRMTEAILVATAIALGVAIGIGVAVL